MMLFVYRHLATHSSPVLSLGLLQDDPLHVRVYHLGRVGGPPFPFPRRINKSQKPTWLSDFFVCRYQNGSQLYCLKKCQLYWFFRNQHGCQLYGFLETNIILSSIVQNPKWLTALLFMETKMVVSCKVYRKPTWLPALLLIKTNMLVRIIA